MLLFKQTKDRKAETCTLLNILIFVLCNIFWGCFLVSFLIIMENLSIKLLQKMFRHKTHSFFTKSLIAFDAATSNQIFFTELQPGRIFPAVHYTLLQPVLANNFFLKLNLESRFMYVRSFISVALYYIGEFYLVFIFSLYLLGLLAF